MRTNKRLYPLFAVCLGLIPFVAGLGIPVLYGTDISEQYPISWSDELMYWHQSASFAVAGFDAGQYSQYEQPAAAAFTPYYAWRPLPPAYYGTIGRIFGWTFYSIPLINMATLAICVAAFVVAARPMSGQFLRLFLVCAAFAPLWIYASSSMIELLQLAGAAATIWPLVSGGPPKREALLAMFMLTILTFLRMSWALLIFPTALFVYKPTTRRQWIVVLFGAVVLTIVLVSLAGWMNTPYQGRLRYP